MTASYLDILYTWFNCGNKINAGKNLQTVLCRFSVFNIFFAFSKGNLFSYVTWSWPFCYLLTKKKKEFREIKKLRDFNKRQIWKETACIKKYNLVAAHTFPPKSCNEFEKSFPKTVNWRNDRVQVRFVQDQRILYKL